MPTDISPRQMQESVQRGHKRLQNFRHARLMFLRNYCGQYYDQVEGDIGTEALNQIFNAVRVLIPNIVMNFPTHNVTSDYLSSRDYAELLGLALQYHDKKVNIRDIYRRVIVDAIFTLGILKTGIAESDTVYAFDEYDHIDTGEVYTECVDFDNLIVDPTSEQHMFRDAKYLGERLIVPRANLLDSGLYNNALLERLPTAGSAVRKERSAKMLSMNGSSTALEYDMHDDIEISEIWVPHTGGAVLLTLPGSPDFTAEEYLRVDDYYGPREGPYTFLALTPPVPGNPLPVPMVGVWNDLHVLGNKMAKKIIDQAIQQRDVIGYKRSAADDVQEVIDAGDGEAVALDDPQSLAVHSLGGQRQSNEVHLASLQAWFNSLSGNTAALAGERFDSGSATETRVLAENSNITLEDMKDLVYQMATQEARKRAWFMHTDPLIQVPLIKREQVPALYSQLPNGMNVLSRPAELADVQVMLTPEARNGDWIDFTFEIEAESMGRRDSRTRYMEAMDFAVKILPSVMSAAQAAMMMGIPFSAPRFLSMMAKDRGIKWMDEVFFDPDFQMKMAQISMMGPGPGGSQGAVTATAGPMNPLAQFLQNGQSGNVMENPSEQKKTKQSEQSGANDMQAILKGMGI